ncbi:MAG: DMT family transporter [Candidatus Thermoplasmatota archaeon]|nr:DMT family transporter [Candidatus Thermoplasmatota archaeon]
MTTRRDVWVTSLAAISAVALWGLAFPLIQTGLESFSPVLLGFLRFALASALVMLIISLKYSLSVISQTIRREWKPLTMLGLLYVTIPNVAQNIGLQHGTSSIASVIQSSGPIMTLLFAVLLLGETMNRNKALGTVVAMSGTVMLVASNGISLADEDFVSNLLILISATSYGLAWVSSKRMLERNPPIIIIGASLLFGTALLALTVPFERPLVAEVDVWSAANLAVLGFLCGSVSSLLYFCSLEKREVSKMAFFIYLMPVFASAFAWVLRAEGVEVWTAFCGVIIVIGIALANRNGDSREQAS